jgi:rod shape-determining protein MreD
VGAGHDRSSAPDDDNIDTRHVHNHVDNDDDDSSGRMTRATRLGALIFLVVVTQVAVFPHLRLFGVVPDLGLIVALAVGYQEGPEAGAIVGFVAGFGFDLFLETPLGLDALTYAIVGYGIGVLESGLFRSPRWLPSFLGAVGGLAGGLLFIGLGVLVGLDAVKGTQGVITISYAAFYDALLAPFVFFLVRRVLGSDDRVRDAW